MTLLRRIERLEGRLGPRACALCASAERFSEALAEAADPVSAKCPQCGRPPDIDDILRAMNLQRLARPAAG
jgi:hypothetical protein